WARSYMEFMDKGTLHMLAKYQEANRVVKGLYDDNLLTGQKTNRPDPPPPMAAGYSQFFQLFWSKDNNPSSLELKVLEMGENDLPKGHKGLAHVNPGGWTYTEGWGPLNRAYVEIMDENSKLRHEMDLEKRIAKLEKKPRRSGWFSSLLDADSTEDKISLGGLGGGMLLAGTIALAGWRRREKREH
ncbi:MAG: multiheme c-type cytochrome, partial [Nitrosomonadaceae bacterium]